MVSLERMYATTQDFAKLYSPRPRRLESARSVRLAGSRPARAILVLGAVLALILGLGFAHGVQGTAPTDYQTVTVQPGDTLWTLAERRYPNEDVRGCVEEIERINGLQDPVLRTGQSLRVPASETQGRQPEGAKLRP
jgi:nucleoid-associated protein YgaU